MSFFISFLKLKLLFVCLAVAGNAFQVLTARCGNLLYVVPKFGGLVFAVWMMVLSADARVVLHDTSHLFLMRDLFFCGPSVR